MADQLDADLEALERFVVDNDDLLALEARVGRFNVFDALGVARAEIRHSNFLVFLLDPNESHGLGQLFLNAFLIDVMKTMPRTHRPFSIVELDGADLGGVVVRREEQSIDLLITSEKPAFVLAIENKVDSSEHSNQLERYEQVIDHHYPDTKAMFLYLTVTGDEPSRPRWVGYTYANLFSAFERVRKANATSIGEDVRVFVDHYLSLIGSRFMDDTKLDELCQRIWRNHRQALRLIYDRAGSPAAGVIGDVEGIVRGDPRWHVYYRSGTFVDFVPSSWMEWLPKWGTSVKSAPQCWFVLRLEVYLGVLTQYAEVRQMSDADKRRGIANTLIDKASAFGFERPNSKRSSEKSTRVAGTKRLLEWPEETPPENETLERAVRERLDVLWTASKHLETELKGLIANSISPA